MGLTVTVQKGHDFSAGNITRAALNNGATPTIGLTGSVGDGEIADNAIDNANIKSDANIAVDKLALASGKIIIGAANGNASALSGTSSFSSVSNETEGNAGLLTDVGDKFEVLKTNTLAAATQDNINDGTQNLNGDSSLSIYTVVTNGVNVNNLRIRHVDNSVYGNHISTANALDDASITKNNSGKLEIKNNGVHWTKLYNYKNSAGAKRSAFLSYGLEGAATPTETTAENQILVSAGANNVPVTNFFFKEIPILTTLDTNNNWHRVAHGLTNPAGSAGVTPKFVRVVLVCKSINSQTSHFYSVNDVVDAHHDSTITIGDNKSSFINVSYDATNIIVNYLGAQLSHFEIPKKYGGATSSSAATGSSATVSLNNVYADFKLMAYVCG